MAAVRADDPLVRAAVDGGIPLGALRGRALIALPRGTGLRGVLDRACAAAGFTPRVDFEAAAPAVLARLAARGLGVAVIPAGAESGAGPGLRALRITDPELSGRVALAWRTDGPSGPAARRLLTLLRAAVPATDRPGPADGPAPR
ncbi:LysR family transcriptional regulator substrate-binding protein [Streptomyces lavendulae]|uniref:LysR family transcriptional regulator substrate-binding protein n=1 Tax=Streptomyces lavendulae TaxID=1914 RepID=UPI00367DF6A1